MNAYNNRAVLIADDEPYIRDVIKGFIKHLGVTIHEAGDGVETMKCVLENNIDLVILDNTMPHINGITVMGVLQKLRPKTAVIFISGNYNDELVIEVMSKGAIDFLSKPFDKNNLVFNVINALNFSKDQ